MKLSDRMKFASPDVFYAKLRGFAEEVAALEARLAEAAARAEIRTIDTRCDGCGRTLRVNLPALADVEVELAAAQAKLAEAEKELALSRGREESRRSAAELRGRALAEAQLQLEKVLDTSKEGAWMARALDAERELAAAQAREAKLRAALDDAHDALVQSVVDLDDPHPSRQSPEVRLRIAGEVSARLGAAAKAAEAALSDSPPPSLAPCCGQPDEAHDLTSPTCPRPAPEVCGAWSHSLAGSCDLPVGHTGNHSSNGDVFAFRAAAPPPPNPPKIPDSSTAQPKSPFGWRAGRRR